MQKESAKNLTELMMVHPLFQTLPEDAVAELCLQSMPVNVLDKEVLITEDELNEALYLIVEGSAKVMMNGTHISDMESGELIGEISVAGTSPPLASVIADGDMRVIVFPREAIHQLMLAHESFAKTIKNMGMERVYNPS